MPRRLRRRTRRKLWQAAGVLSVLALVAAVWPSGSRHHPTRTPNAASTPGTNVATPSRVPGPDAPIGSGSLSGLNGFPFALPASNRSNTPGPHDVVLDVTSDAKLGAVAYQTRSGARYLAHSVTAPMRFATRVSGPGLLAVLAVQAGPDARSATCRITVDGVTANVRTAPGPNQVVVCLA